MKKEHEDMAAADETALKWAKADYVREQMECQRRAFEEIVAQRRGREEGGVVVLDSDDEDAPGPSNPPRVGDLVRGAVGTMEAPAGRRAMTTTAVAAAATTPSSTGSSTCRRRAAATA